MKRFLGILASSLFIIIFVFLVTVSSPRDVNAKEIENSFLIYQGKNIGNAYERVENVINYLIGREETLKGMNEKETAHLKDVRRIFTILQIIAIISLAYIAFLSFKNHDVIGIIGEGAKYSLIVPLIIIIPVLFFFDPFFTLLHKILFANNFWLLDPYRSTLILLFPESYFQHIGILFIINLTITSIVLILLEKLYYKKYHIGKQ